MSGDKKSNVTFTKCPIDATKIQGAIHKWQLEDGQIIDPANVVTDKQSLTTNKLYTWANNEAKKEWEFQGKADLSFDNGETVIWTGPNNGEIQLTAPEKLSRWKVTEGDENPSPK